MSRDPFALDPNIQPYDDQTSTAHSPRKEKTVEQSDERFGDRVPSRKEIVALFKDYDAIKPKRGDDVFIVEFPFDKNMNDRLKQIGARWDNTAKHFVVVMASYRKLEIIAPEIAALCHERWVQTLKRQEEDSNLSEKIEVPYHEKDKYPIGQAIRHRQHSFIVEHIGQPYEKDSKKMCWVYLERSKI